MEQPRDLDAVADACLKANSLIEQHGTPQMRSLMRVLLFLIGRELAQRVGTIAAAESRIPE